MISAKEARSFADEVTIAARQRKEYPILIGDIEREITRVSKMGRYSIHYWFTDVSFRMMESSLNLNDPVLSAQFNNRSDSSLYAKNSHICLLWCMRKIKKPFVTVWNYMDSKLSLFL